jgi:N-acetylmuramoyl-L-alanine amidase
MRPVSVPCSRFDTRRLPLTIIVLHGVAPGAAARMTDPADDTSFHYLIDAEGQAFAPVAEDDRAWHCADGQWRGVRDLDSASIGIALEQQGPDFPPAQVDAAIRLVAEVKDRYSITRGNVVGASDIAPGRRRDPGEFFPWHRLSRLRLALPRPTRGLMDPHWNEASFLLALERFGYDVADPRAAIMAFQRRFRPEMIDGEMDAECRMILLALLLPQPQGD